MINKKLYKVNYKALRDDQSDLNNEKYLGNRRLSMYRNQ